MLAPEAADAVIVGAGAAGSVLASRLARGGMRVVVLERGPDREPAELVSSQVWARRMRGSDGAESSRQAYLHLNASTGVGSGGAALQHHGVWERLHSEDFRTHAVYGRGLDWPLAYEELRPFYDEVQQEVGLSGDARKEIWRPAGAPYPMPPLASFRQAERLRRGFHALGMRTAPLPSAINSRPFRDRPACMYDGWCDAGCPTGALANPHVVYLPAARRAGAELRTHARVTRVLVDLLSERAIGVEYYDARGVQRVQRARWIVLASNAVEVPRILLNSSTPAQPAGLANSSGLVGRYLAAPLRTDVFGLFDEETECHRGTSGGQLLCQDGYAKRTHPGAFGSAQWQIAPALKPNGLLGIARSRPELYGDPLHAFVERAAKHLGVLRALSEDQASPLNRVELADERDELGFPRARVDHTHGPDALALVRRMQEEGARILKAAGATEVWSGAPAASHLTGGVVMGTDPAESVTNTYGQTHDLPNLVVAGASLFPTSGAVPPTFTIHALAVRAAERLLAVSSG